MNGRDTADTPQDRTDATVITLRYRDGRGERIEIEPRGDGTHDVVEKTLQRDGTFREIGHDIAERVDVG